MTKNTANKSILPSLTLIIASLLFTVSCEKTEQQEINPKLDYAVQDKYLRALEPAFSPLSTEELQSDWGKEYYLAQAFAKKLDLYQAILTFKRAEILISPLESLRHREIQYLTLYCYYLGKKYHDVIDIFEHSTLIHADDTFVGYKDLLAILFESYYKTKDREKAKWILHVMQRNFPAHAKRLAMTHAVYNGDTFELGRIASDPTPKRSLSEILAGAYHKSKQEIDAATVHLISNAQNGTKEDYILSERLDPALMEQVNYLSNYAASQDSLDHVLTSYKKYKKSPKTAQLLNALVPGSGYLYLGQKQTAITSFMINSLFFWSSVYLFKHNNIPAGILTSSFEMGWYIGGIQGAEKAATLYNERLYERYAHNHLRDNKLYPILMLSYGF